ncbi:MAG: D-alanine--D-alanine ligase [Clostridia bacterium]|nr:D-alanine--D-alanine ligase [Clostridia bacterium]
MAEKIRVGILFGGRSGEHEVSILSAGSVYKALDRDKFEPVAIAISKEGTWYLMEDPEDVFKKGEIDFDKGKPVTILCQPVKNNFVTLDGKALEPLDVVFPVLHGTFGEDGTVQGLLDLAGIPYVGAGVLASAAGMDKVIMKKLFRHAGLPVVKDMAVMRREFQEDPHGVISRIEENIPYPCFVKPANLGSSVGVSKAKNREELAAALEEAAIYDRKLVVEQGVEAREIECSVMGNDHPRCSVPGEIIPSGEFYDYEAKYLSGQSELIIPAPLSEEQRERVRRLAVEAFKAVDCSGLARVDFFVTKDTGEIYVNEINTMPGFTKISMFPKLWEASGVPYGELLTRLIDLAFERHRDRSRNVTEYKELKK